MSSLGLFSFAQAKPVTAAKFEARSFSTSSNFWRAEGQWSSSFARQANVGRFALNVEVLPPNLDGVSTVLGHVLTPIGQTSLRFGEYTESNRKLIMAHEVFASNGPRALVVMLGHISFDIRLYSAELFVLIPSSAEDIAEDSLTQALLTDLNLPLSLTQGRLIRPYGSVSAFAQ